MARKTFMDKRRLFTSKMKPELKKRIMNYENKAEGSPQGNTKKRKKEYTDIRLPGKRWLCITKARI